MQRGFARILQVAVRTLNPIRMGKRSTLPICTETLRANAEPGNPLDVLVDAGP